MAIITEIHNVIVRKETLEAKYPGGLAQYKADCPNRTFLEDEYLTSVAFMGGDGEFEKSLEAKGLVLMEPPASEQNEQVLKILEGKQTGKRKVFRFVDIALPTRMISPESPLAVQCDWLTVRPPSGKSGLAGQAACWLKGKRPGKFVMAAYRHINPPKKQTKKGLTCTPKGL